MEKILVTCAHPDDETLGLGGTIKLHSKQGDKITVMIFADGESAREKTKDRIKARKKQAIEAGKILGIDKIIFLDYMDQKLDTFPALELAKKIEKEIKKIKPTTVYTHFWGDVNQDHRRVFEATQIATRPTPDSKINRLICFETPSSSEWGHEKIKPNYYVNIQSVLSTKIRAFKKYRFEITKFPHPRSEQAMIDRSRYWGSVVGLKNAEAFFVVREIIRNKK